MTTSSDQGGANRPDNSSPHYILIHGSWHGGWCWQDVVTEIEKTGATCNAIDLPGHGANTLLPSSYQTAPLVGDDFSSELSPLADLHAADYAASVIAAASDARRAGASRIVGVGHSMGGVPLTFAAAVEPDLFDGLVYVTALTPVKTQPAGVFLALPEQHEKSMLGAILQGDPEVIGALRINPSSRDSAYLKTAHQALAADVEEDEFIKVFRRLTPDAPAGIYGELPEFASGNSGDFGVIPRRFIRCTNDHTLLPSTANAVSDALDADWTKRKTEKIDLASGHEPMFSCPQQLARAIMAPPV